MNQKQPSEKIYITYKTRMLSEARLMNQHRFLTNLVTWYSFCLIFFGLLQISGNLTSTYATIAFTAAAIAIFGLSLYISGQKFAERAEQFRSCHLQLKELYESEVNEATKMKRYAEILKIFENQEDIDFDEMVFDAYRRGQELYNSEGALPLTKFTKFVVVARKIIRFCFRILLSAVVPGIFLTAVLVADRSGG